jgi:hypothetical protein
MSLFQVTFVSSPAEQSVKEVPVQNASIAVPPSL